MKVKESFKTIAKITLPPLQCRCIAALQITKYSDLRKHAVLETSLMLLMSYTSYIIGEGFGLSGMQASSFLPHYPCIETFRIYYCVGIDQKEMKTRCAQNCNQSSTHGDRISGRILGKDLALCTHVSRKVWIVYGSYILHRDCRHSVLRHGPVALHVAQLVARIPRHGPRPRRGPELYVGKLYLLLPGHLALHVPEP